MKNPSLFPRIVPLQNPLQVIKKTLVRACRDRRFVKSVNSESVITAIPGTAFEIFSGDYLISGDRGIFAIKNKTLLRLLGTRTYGIAIQGEYLFAASSNDHYSSILKARLPDMIVAGESLRFSEIFRIATNKKGRIHQIAFFAGRLAVTYTDANTILLLDPDSGEVQSEYMPFRDQFGQPIVGDHNHINSVSQCGDSLLFCAYRAGPGSLIGVIHGNRVRGYAVNRVGVHDVHVTDDVLYYSDTFGDLGSQSGHSCGFLMENGRPLDEVYFSRPPGWAIRGIARTGDELIVGHSHKGLDRSGMMAMAACFGSSTGTW